jgi:hypothetical protein
VPRSIRDIEATWPNVLGFLRRVPGQKYDRSPPAGTPADEPTQVELVAFRDAMRIHIARLERATGTK